METFQILSDQFSHFQHLFHRWLAIFCIISSYIFDLSSSPHTWGIPGSITWSQQWRTVHPHLRGAYGTPPRHAVQKQRFIPTCVGHTPAPPHPAPCRSVHPHMRRAYRFTAPFWASVPGSSPHTWGIRCRRLPPLCRCSVHPHLRGAYESNTGTRPTIMRFIPTYVGHTGSGTPALSRYAVHPHIRGAYRDLALQVLHALGSSPHTWGIRIIKRAGLSKITGSSPHTWGIQTVTPYCRASLAVHPHIRGAYAGWQQHQINAFGSSPHTWGILKMGI